MQFLLPTYEDAQAFGRTLGRLLRAGDVIALIGDLGAGKTTLTQGIAQGMGIAESVTSPTFTLVQEYGRALPLFHFDPYRLEQPEDIYDFGFDEYLERGGVVVVEWADKIAPLLPLERLTLRLTEQQKAENQEQEHTARVVDIEASGARYEQLLEGLKYAP